LASLAHTFLDLLLVFNGGLKVSLKVNHVLSVVVVASTARVVRAEAEDNEAHGSEDGISILFFSKLVVVSFDKLALLELDGVSGDVNVVFFIFVELTPKLRVGGDLGSTHQLGDIGALAIVAALFRSKLVGRSQSRKDGGEGKREFHGGESVSKTKEGNVRRMVDNNRFQVVTRLPPLKTKLFEPIVSFRNAKTMIAMDESTM
jgi:hypothetical protein